MPRPPGRPVEDQLPEVEDVNVVADVHHQGHIVLHQHDAAAPLLTVRRSMASNASVSDRSRPDDGSSSIKMSNRPARQRASSTRRLCPVESDPACRPARSAIPHSSIADQAAASVSACAGMVWRTSGRSRSSRPGPLLGPRPRSRRQSAARTAPSSGRCDPARVGRGPPADSPVTSWPRKRMRPSIPAVEAADGIEGGGLACAVGPYQPGDATEGRREAEIVDGYQAAERHPEGCTSSPSPCGAGGHGAAPAQMPVRLGVFPISQKIGAIVVGIPGWPPRMATEIADTPNRALSQ